MNNNPTSFTPEEYERILENLSTFKVPQLKSVAKGLAIAQTGRKADINDRVRRYIQYARETNDNMKLFAIRDLVRDAAVGRTDLSINNYVGRYTHLQPGASANKGKAQRAPWIFFKENPFFTLIKLVHPNAGYCHQASGRGTSNVEFKLTEDRIQQLQTDPNKRLYLLCAPKDQNSNSAYIEFPAPLEIHFNGTQLQDNVKGIKGKPGTAKPADLTPYIKSLPNETNVLELVYAFTKVDYLYFCYMVEKVSPEKILHQILANEHISTATTLAEFNAEPDEDDIQEMSSVLSLKCPLSYTRMKYPAKTIYCKHLTCFDALSFIQLQEQMSTWDCPICHQKVTIKELVISDYVQDIIKVTAGNVESVELEADGSWNAVIESDDDYSDSDNDHPAPSGKKSVEPEIISLDSDTDEEPIEQLNSNPNQQQQQQQHQQTNNSEPVVLEDSADVEVPDAPAPAQTKIQQQQQSLQKENEDQEMNTTLDDYISAYDGTPIAEGMDDDKDNSLNAGTNDEATHQSHPDQPHQNQSQPPSFRDVNASANTSGRITSISNANLLLPYSDRLDQQLRQVNPSTTSTFNPLLHPSPPKFPPIVKGPPPFPSPNNSQNSVPPPPSLAIATSGIICASSSEPQHTSSHKDDVASPTTFTDTSVSVGTEAVSSSGATRSTTETNPQDHNDSITPAADVSMADNDTHTPVINRVNGTSVTTVESPGLSKLASLLSVNSSTGSPSSPLPQVAATASTGSIQQPLPTVAAPPPVIETQSSIRLSRLSQEMEELNNIQASLQKSNSTNNSSSSSNPPVPPPHGTITTSKSSLFPGALSGSTSASPVVGIFKTNNTFVETPPTLGAHAQSTLLTLPTESQRSLQQHLASRENTLNQSRASSASPNQGSSAQLNQVQALTQNLQRSVSANYISKQTPSQNSTNGATADNDPPVVVSPPHMINSVSNNGNGTSPILKSSSVPPPPMVSSNKWKNSLLNIQNPGVDVPPVPPPHGYNNNNIYQQPQQQPQPEPQPPQQRQGYHDNDQYNDSHGHSHDTSSSNQRPSIFMPPSQQHDPSQRQIKPASFFMPTGSAGTANNNNNGKRSISGDHSNNGYGQHVHKKPAPIVIDLTLDTDEE